MKSNVLVSVIVPVFNSDKFLSRCIDSVLVQTYPNFEVILIDDGSTDNSGGICDEYVKKDSRVRAIHKQNSGVSATRNVGLEKAKGKYILFVDSDDYIDNIMLEKLVSKAEEKQSDITVCNYYVQNGNDIHVPEMNYECQYNTNEEIVEKLIFRFYCGKNIGLNSLWNKLILRSLFVENGIKFDCNLKRAEDFWFVFECMKKANRIVFINEPYYHYVQNPESVMHTIYLDQYQQWKYTRKRLLMENKQFGFRLDMSVFYSSFLLNSVLFVKELLFQSKKDLAMEVLQDEMFREATKYVKNSSLPAHIKILLYLVNKKQYAAVCLLLHIWNIL